MEWVGAHLEGELWFKLPQAPSMYQIDIDTEEWRAVAQAASYAAEGQNSNWINGLGHDGYNMWYSEGSGGGTTIRIMEDGIDEVYISWVAVEPEEGSVATGEEQDVTMIFSTEGMEENFVTYEADVMIFTNDPQHGVITIRCELSVGTRLQWYDNCLETDRVHNITISDLIFRGETVPTGWEIGVFTEDDALAGAIVWRDDAATIVPAYGASGDLPGFSNGEALTFKVYDPAVETEYDWIRMEFTDGPAVWVNNGNSTATLTALPVEEQEIVLLDGWNLNSINVAPVDNMWIMEDGPDPELMCTDVFFDADAETWSMIQMKDENGDFCSPAWIFWGIPFWNLCEGYQFNIDAGDEEEIEVSFYGAPIDAQADMFGLDNGWNIMAYYPNYDLECDFIDDDDENNFYVIHEIIDYVILAKDVNGDFCSPAYGFSSMAPWEAGQGYQINLSEDIEVFNYPVELDNRAAMPRQMRSTGETHWARPVATGENMSVLVTAISGLSINEGDQIAAFNIDGELVGTGVFVDGKCGIPVLGDNSSTEAVEGMLDGEAFELKLWDADREIVVDLNAGVIKEGNGLVYKRNGLAVLDVKVDEAIPTEFSLAQNYPNPFNSTTRMAYEVPELSKVSLQVFDLAGRHVTTLVDGQRQAGRYTAVWEARDVSSGIYIVQMKAANFNSVRKVMLVK